MAEELGKLSVVSEARQKDAKVTKGRLRNPPKWEILVIFYVMLSVEFQHFKESCQRHFEQLF